MRPRDSALGMTLIEVMVGILLFAILAAGGFAAFSGQQNTTQFQQRSESTLDSSRSLLNLIAMQARAAKGGAPQGSVRFNSKGSWSAPSPAPISTLDNLLDNTITAGGTGANCGGPPEFQVPIIQVLDGGASGPDVLRILSPDGAAWGRFETSNRGMGTQSLGPTRETQSIHFRTPFPSPATVPNLLQEDWVLVSDFQANTIVYRLETAPISIELGDWSFDTQPTGAPSPYPLATASTEIERPFLIKARWVEYRIVTSGPDSTLMVTDLLRGITEPAAEAVEDLQVSLGFDWQPTDGRITPDNPLNLGLDEWIYNGAGEQLAAAAGGSECSLRNLRAIRVSIVTRATSEAPGARSTRPAVENRAAGAPDGFYRVLLQSVIALR